MRQIQRENKRKEKGRIREQPVKALWKSSKFENVPPRVFDFQVRDSAGVICSAAALDVTFLCYRGPCFGLLPLPAHSLSCIIVALL